MTKHCEDVQSISSYVHIVWISLDIKSQRNIYKLFDFAHLQIVYSGN